MKGNIPEGKLLISEFDEKVGKIIVPHVVAGAQRRGEVMLSNGQEVEVGDIVVHKDRGVGMTIENEEYRLIDESVVLWIES